MSSYYSFMSSYYSFMPQLLYLHVPILFLHNGIFGKLEQELFGSHIAEVDCGFLIVATAFHVRHGATPKALVFYHRAYCQGMGSRGLRGMDKGVDGWFYAAKLGLLGHGVGHELCGHRTGVLQVAPSPAG